MPGVEPDVAGKFAEVDSALVELDGPFECSVCGGHVTLDATFGDQVSCHVVCPYCETRVLVDGWEE